jgi:prenyltransferase beta subunit
MLQVARLAPKILADSTDRVADFLRSQMNPDGGFKDRAGNSDLYYTVFGIEGLFALRADLPTQSLEKYLRSFGAGEELDLVHVACLARCWAMLPPESLDEKARDAILSHLESHRSADGGYNASRAAPTGTIYGCFLALGAYQDLGRDIVDQQGITNCIQSLRTDDGGYANQRELPMGLTPSTAAAVTILRHLDQPVDDKLADWLLARVHGEGGFFATPAAPIPDLLSTATALHALAAMQADFAKITESTLDFIDTLWSSQGGFFGNWEDDTLDCEYTYYGLLALGHLSVA